VRVELRGLDEHMTEAYSRHPALKMDLFLLPYHGVAASTDFGHDTGFDPQYDIGRTGQRDGSRTISST